MAERSYWLDVFTATTWQEFLDAGANVSGFRESRWSTLSEFVFCALSLLPSLSTRRNSESDSPENCLARDFLAVCPK
jgi:hypothetical protein